MIKQTDPQTGPVIAKFGCYFFSLLYKVEKRTGIVFDWPKIQAIYISAMQSGIIGPEQFDANGDPVDGCFVNDAQALLNLAGAGNAQVLQGGFEAAMFPVGTALDASNEVIQRWFNPATGFYHFVCGDASGGVEWDPIEEADGSGSVTVRDGKQDAWRILNFV